MIACGQNKKLEGGDEKMGFSIYDELAMMSDEELKEINELIPKYLEQRKEEREDEDDEGGLL